MFSRLARAVITSLSPPSYCCPSAGVLFLIHPSPHPRVCRCPALHTKASRWRLAAPSQPPDTKKDVHKRCSRSGPVRGGRANGSLEIREDSGSRDRAAKRKSGRRLSFFSLFPFASLKPPLPRLIPSENMVLYTHWKVSAVTRGGVFVWVPKLDYLRCLAPGVFFTSCLSATSLKRQCTRLTSFHI